MAGFPDELFQGLTGQQREDRLALLRWLSGRGVSVEAIADAARAGHLALLPTELLLTSDCRYSLGQAAEKAGLSPEFIARVWRAAGIAVPDGDEAVLDDEDLQAITFARRVLDAGFSEEAYIEISRVVGRGAAPTAESLVQISIERFLEPAPGEARFAMTLYEIAEQLTPLLPFLLALPVRMHLRAAIRNHALERSGEELLALSGTRQLAVGFADMVGFTAMTQASSLATSGELARKLDQLAAAVAEPPVRLIKLIGDAAMLTSEDPVGLTTAMLKLGELAAAEPDFPALRMGVANGDVAARGGDVYGPAVNLASRLSDIAGPGQLLASTELAKRLPDGFNVRHQHQREIKGIGSYEPVEIVGKQNAVHAPH